MLGLELGVQGWDILSAYALRSFTVKEKKVQVAMMGLLGKMTGSAAVSGLDMYVESNGRLRIWVSLKALGTMGLYVSDLAKRDIDQQLMIMIFGKPISRDCVRDSARDENVLEIDVDKAWKDSGEEAGWSNEVSVEVFIS